MSKVTIGKFFKSSGMGACILALLFTGSLFIIASGGGGGDSSAPAESAVLDSGNADAAADAIMQSLDMAGPTAMLDGGVPLSAAGGAMQVDSPLRGVFSTALDGYRTAVAEAQGMSTPLVQYDCENVGVGTMDIPDLTEQDLIQASITGSLSITMSYSNCVQGTQTLDGSMTMHIIGDVVNHNVNSMTITASYFNFIDSATSENIIMTGYQMIGDQLTFDAQDELTAATFRITGDIQGTVDGQAIDASFHRFAVRFVEQVGGETLTINGMLNNDCIGGWATVSTATPLFMPDLADCPTAGVFSVKSGDNIVRAEAASNSSVSVYFNDVLVTTYTTCNDVEGSCVN